MSKQHSAISSYFTPVKKPENPINRPKVTISNTLKSANSKAAAVSFSPKQYQKPKGPFDLSSPSSQSTEKLTNHLAQFKFNNSQQKPPPLLRDLNTPKNAVINLDSDDDIDRLLMEDEEEEEEEAVESNDSEDNSVAVTTTRRVLRKRKQRQPIMIQDSEDEDLIEEEEEEEQPQFKRIKKTRRTISDMTDEDDEMDDDDDGDDSYVDENQKLNQAYDAEEEETSVNRIKGILPKLPVERIREAIRKTGSAVKAIIYLNKQIEQEEKGISIDLDAEEEDEEMEQQTRDQLDAVERDILVLKMFNTASATEIQAMTGCKTNKAEIMVEELRPFEDMDDLEDKLKKTKGLSVKYIDVFQEMVDGYYKVDAMIREIEKKGTRLRSILNIWQGIKTPTGGQNTPVVGSDNEDDDKPDEKAGTHLMHLDVNPCIDQDSEEYKDAMDGYISQQPKYVNKEFTLKDYQILGVNWMLLLYRKGISGILADEMGLGKTAQVISFLGRLYEMGESGPHLVIVPSSTMENWMREFERFCPKLKVRLYHGSINERAEQRYELSEERDEFQVLVTTYNVATSNKDDRSFLRQLRCTSMVLDEGHMIKNCTSARYINLMKIKTPFRLLLTGTPLQNNLQELVSLLMFIMPDTFSAREEELRSIFKIRTSSTSTDQYQQDGKEKQGSETAVQILSRERIQRAKQMMTPFVLRRKKQDVLKDLPQKQQVIQKCIMTTNQKQLYSDIILKSKKSLEAQQEENKKETKSAMKQQFESMSNIIVHLRKAADHPLLFRKIYTDELLRTMAKEIMAEVKYWDANEEYIYEDMTVMSDFELNNLCKEHKKISHHQLKNEEWMDSGKIEKLKEILPACKARKEKVLIFSQFTRMLDILELVMSTLNVTYVRLDGETKVMVLIKLFVEFNTNESIQVFLLSTKAGGFGINLTAANVVVLYDLDFNPQNDKQAEDRAHRVGQTKDVRIIKLISQDSIEEYILKMADIKLRLDKRISSSTAQDEGEEQQDEDEDDSDDPQQQKQSLQSMIREAFIQADKIYK